MSRPRTSEIHSVKTTNQVKLLCYDSQQIGPHYRGRITHVHAQAYQLHCIHMMITELPIKPEPEEEGELVGYKSKSS